MQDNILLELSCKEKKIRDLQQRKAKMEGQRDQILAQLESDFEVKTLDEACGKLEASQKQVEENNRQLVELDSKMGEILQSATQGSNQ